MRAKRFAMTIPNFVACLAKVQFGSVRLCLAVLDKAMRGKEKTQIQKQSMAGRGMAWPGKVKQCSAHLGKAR